MTIKLEVYDLFLFFNPYGCTNHNPPTHLNPYGVRIEKIVQNIGRSLRVIEMVSRRTEPEQTEVYTSIYVEVHGLPFWYT